MARKYLVIPASPMESGRKFLTTNQAKLAEEVSSAYIFFIRERNIHIFCENYEEVMNEQFDDRQLPIENIAVGQTR